ncbi:hypothetical protein ABK040_008972 [Willaertia magna]
MNEIQYYEFCNEEERDTSKYDNHYPSINLICSPSFHRNAFTIIVTHAGDVYLKGCFGESYFHNFTKIKNLSNIKFAGCGENYALFIDDNNKLFGCGIDYGQFGSTIDNVDEDDVAFFEMTVDIKQYLEIKDKIKFIHCSSEITIIVTMDDNILFGGNSIVFNGKCEYVSGYKKLENVPRTDIKDLKCGLFHSILLDYFGNVYGSGKNISGQLGLEDFTIILNSFQKLNIPFKVKQVMPTLNGTLLLNFNNEIYGSGSLYLYDPPLTGFVKINLFKDTIYSLKFLSVDDDRIYILLNKNKFYMIDYKEIGKNNDIKPINVNFTKNWNYYYFELSDSSFLYLIGSDYKINKRYYSNNNEIKKKLLKQLTNNEMNQFVDINILFEENELKRINNYSNECDKIKKRKLFTK